MYPQLNNSTKELAKSFILEGTGDIATLKAHYQNGTAQEQHQFGFSFVQHCVRFCLNLTPSCPLNVITQKLVHATSLLPDKHFIYAIDKFLIDLTSHLAKNEKDSFQAEFKPVLSMANLINIKDVFLNSPLSKKKSQLALSLIKGHMDNHFSMDAEPLVQKKHLKLVHRSA